MMINVTFHWRRLRPRQHCMCALCFLPASCDGLFHHAMIVQYVLALVGLLGLTHNRCGLLSLKLSLLDLALNQLPPLETRLGLIHWLAVTASSSISKFTSYFSSSSMRDPCGDVAQAGRSFRNPEARRSSQNSKMGRSSRMPRRTVCLRHTIVYVVTSQSTVTLLLSSQTFDRSCIGRKSWLVAN